MAEIIVEQALYHRQGSVAPRLLGRSPGFQDEWLSEGEWLVMGFGDPPPGVPFPAAVYAQPLGKEHVAVVQVANQDASAAQREPALDFHVLVIPRAAYTKFLGDPFAVARRLPPPWGGPDELPARTLPAEPLPPRTVQEVQKVLQRTKGAALREDVDPTSEDAWEHTMDNAESPALLGGVQVLVDGGKVVFERPRADTDLMHGLWTLLPTSTRCHLWPASFAFGNALGFDALVTPRARGEAFEGYTNEDQAAEYPEGRYERNLQVTAETGDQRELDALFGRRSVKETIRLGVTLLVMLSVLVVTVGFLDVTPAPVPPSAELTRERVAVAVSLVGTHAPLNTVTMLHAAHQAWKAIPREQP
jgi:hypothetical protein